MRCYKVISSVDSSLHSAIVGGKALVTYKPGEFVTAPQHLAQQGYHLLVFADIHSAKDFTDLMSTGTHVIWSCECEEEMPLPPICSLFDIHRGRLQPLSVGSWPAGTKMFKRVKLLEMVRPRTSP